MKRSAGFGSVSALFLTMISVALAQGQFTLGQTSAGSGGASSGGVYTLRDAIGEPGAGLSSGGSYQLIGGLALGGRAVAPAVTFALNVTTNGNGTVTLDPPGGIYVAGTVVQLIAVPATGFTFVGWSGAVNSAANTVQVTMDSDKALTATFTQTPAGNHTLNINVLGRGTVTLNPPGNSYAEGTVVQLTAIPSTGFTFASWGGAVTGTINPTPITMNSDKAITVTFVQTSFGDNHVYLPMVQR